MRGLMRDEFQQVASDAGGVVAGYAGFFQVIAEHRNHAKGFDLIEIVDNLAGTFGRILGLQIVGGRSAVDECVVEELFLRMAAEGSDMVCRREA